MNADELLKQFEHIVDELHNLFVETIDTFDRDWMIYVDDYWKEKHRYDDDIKRLWDKHDEIFSMYVDLLIEKKNWRNHAEKTKETDEGRTQRRAEERSRRVRQENSG